LAFWWSIKDLDFNARLRKFLIFPADVPWDGRNDLKKVDWHQRVPAHAIYMVIFFADGCGS
jgi:hypothetical protein